MSLIGGDHNFDFNDKIFTRQISWQKKVHGKRSNIHKVMTLCALLEGKRLTDS